MITVWQKMFTGEVEGFKFYYGKVELMDQHIVFFDKFFGDIPFVLFMKGVFNNTRVTCLSRHKFTIFLRYIRLIREKSIALLLAKY